MTGVFPILKRPNILIALLVGLTAFAFIYLLTITVQDDNYLESLDSYKLPSDYTLKYKFFDIDRLEWLSEEIANQKLIDTDWKETKLPSPIWKDEDIEFNKWIVYRLRFEAKEDGTLYAFAPTTIAHPTIKTYVNGVKVNHYKSYQNHKHFYLFPLVGEPQEVKTHVVTIIAQLDKFTWGLNSNLGYFLGPYDKFPRLNYTYLNIGMYPRTMTLIGTILTILLIVMVFLLPSHWNFKNLVFYSFFFHVIALLPLMYMDLKNAIIGHQIIAFGQALGYMFLGFFVLDYLEIQKKKIPRAGMYLFATLYFSTQLLYSIPDHWMVYLRLLFIGTLTLCGIYKWRHAKLGSSIEDNNKKLLVVFLGLIFVLDFYESFFHFVLFYNRNQVLHVAFVVGIVYLSVRSFRENEMKAKTALKVESEMQVLQKSFRVFKHDLIGPFNKVSILSSFIKNAQNKDQFETMQKKILQIMDEMVEERQYLETMITDTEDSISNAPISKEPFKPDDVFTLDKLDIYKNIGKEKPEFKIELSPSPIVSDANRLLRVFRNLVKNAIHATNGKTLISLSSQSKDNSVVFSLKNTNSYISPKVIDHLFKPFVSTSPKNMGLGLYICKSLVERLGGNISVLNLPDGVEFRIEISSS